MEVTKELFNKTSICEFFKKGTCVRGTKVILCINYFIFIFLISGIVINIRVFRGYSVDLAILQHPKQYHLPQFV